MGRRRRRFSRREGSKTNANRWKKKKNNNTTQNRRTEQSGAKRLTYILSRASTMKLKKLTTATRHRDPRRAEVYEIITAVDCAPGLGSRRMERVPAGIGWRTRNRPRLMRRRDEWTVRRFHVPRGSRYARTTR